MILLYLNVWKTEVQEAKGHAMIGLGGHVGPGCRCVAQSQQGAQTQTPAPLWWPVIIVQDFGGNFKKTSLLLLLFVA